MLSTCIRPVSTWLIGTVVPMPSAADEMIDDADGFADALLVVAEVALVVAEIGVDMGNLCLFGRRIAPGVPQSSPAHARGARLAGGVWFWEAAGAHARAASKTGRRMCTGRVLRGY